MLTAVATTVTTLLLLATQALPSGWPTPTRSAREPVTLARELVSVRPHDPTAWTQGLQLDHQGRLFESTGRLGRSTIRQVDAASGVVLHEVSLPPDQFGEGLALVDDRLIQLTWREGVAHIWDADSLEPLGSFEYEGEGWGLCFDGERLVMSDGSQRLTFRDPSSFEILGSIEVDGAGLPPMRFNELECVDGSVWANAWLTDTIVRIDPAEGRVTGSLDLAGLLGEWATPSDGLSPAEPPDVLNGIAWDAQTGTFLVTGKLWPALFEIRVEDGGQPSTPPG